MGIQRKERSLLSGKRRGQQRLLEDMGLNLAQTLKCGQDLGWGREESDSRIYNRKRLLQV